MHAVRRVDLQARLAILAGHNFIHVGGTKPKARMTVLLAADAGTDLRMHKQMGWLIFVVPRSGKMDVGELVEGQRSVELHVVIGMAMAGLAKTMHP